MGKGEDRSDKSQTATHPTIYYYFEYLHNEMKKREQQPLNTLLSVFLSQFDSLILG